jgi:hypothetical protein
MPGVPSYQRQLGAEVRDLTLKEIKSILLDEKNEKHGKEFRQQVILRLAGNVLPRINEVTGEGGEPLQIQIIRANDKENTTTPISG